VLNLRSALQAEQGLQPALLGRGLTEDHGALRTLVRDVLRQGGHPVLEALDGVEGLALGQSHPGPIQLLITDVMLPGLDGSQLARRLTSLRPKLKVLFLPGTEQAALEQQTGAHPGMDFLRKPFTPDRLMGKVRSLLAGTEG
jgi:CheY-like chemotaxis protein